VGVSQKHPRPHHFPQARTYETKSTAAKCSIYLCLKYCIYRDEGNFKSSVESLPLRVPRRFPNRPWMNRALVSGERKPTRTEVRSRQTGASRLRKPLTRLTTNGVIHVLSEKGSLITASFIELSEVMGIIGTKSLHHSASLGLILWDLMGSGDDDCFGTYATS